MKQWLTNPVVLICAGIIVLGMIGLFWAVGKWRRLSSGESATFRPADELFPSAPDLRGIDFRAPTMTPPAPALAPAAPAASPVSKDVAARLDSMSQRLAEMQSVLQKQSSSGDTAQASAAPGGVGQGFSPETIDKLLKIIGNVIQQVDILQKSVNTGKE